METTLVASLLKLGAPWVMVAILLYLFIAERKRKDEMADKLYELAISQVKVNTETKRSIESVEKDVDDISRRFKT